MYVLSYLVDLAELGNGSNFFNIHIYIISKTPTNER